MRAASSWIRIARHLLAERVLDRRWMVGPVGAEDLSDPVGLGFNSAVAAGALERGPQLRARQPRGTPGCRSRLEEFMRLSAAQTWDINRSSGAGGRKHLWTKSRGERHGGAGRRRSMTRPESGQRANGPTPGAHAAVTIINRRTARRSMRRSLQTWFAGGVAALYSNIPRSLRFMMTPLTTD